MKKRITLVLLTAALVITLTTGCTEKDEKLAEMKADQSQNIVDVVGISGIEEDLGVTILLPASVSGENCKVIDGKTGLVEFTIEDAEYAFYIESATEARDATGIAAGLPNKETILMDNATYQLAYQEGGPVIATWYDKAHRISCTLILLEASDQEGLKAMAESIIAVQQ